MRRSSWSGRLVLGLKWTCSDTMIRKTGKPSCVTDIPALGKDPFHQWLHCQKPDELDELVCEDLLDCCLRYALTVKMPKYLSMVLDDSLLHGTTFSSICILNLGAKDRRRIANQSRPGRPIFLRPNITRIYKLNQEVRDLFQFKHKRSCSRTDAEARFRPILAPLEDRHVLLTYIHLYDRHK